MVLAFVATFRGVDGGEELGVVDVYLVGVEADDGAILLVERLELFEHVAMLDDVVVDFVEIGCCCELWAWDL